MSDTVIIGGGVIGLTSAFELAKRGTSVTVIESRQIGKEASWAGAGMLPPGRCRGHATLKQLSSHSAELWPFLAEELQERTGIDNGYRRCGGLQICCQPEKSCLDEASLWEQESIPVERFCGSDLHRLFPVLGKEIDEAFLLPTMAQVRNPHHLQALKAACTDLNVTIVEQSEVKKFSVDKEHVKCAVTNTKEFPAEEFIITSGAWSSSLLQQLNIEFAVKPIRGQIILMKFPEPPFSHIIEDGPRYLVPRDDGHLLIGSTEEDAGFVKENSDASIDQLLQFAQQVVPELSQSNIVQCWTGLRPKAVRGYPWIGRSKNISNLTIATGHFRDGLQQSPLTGRIVADLVCHRETAFPLGDLAK